MRSEATGSTEHFGAYLRRGREARGLSIAEVSRATKIKEQALELIEQAKLDALPAPVFVRGFVSAYAREVGLDVSEAMRKLSQKLPLVEPEAQPLPKKIVQPAPTDDDPQDDRSRKVGVALVVLLILVVATLTLSLLLRHGRAAEGLSSRALLEDHVHV